MWTELCFLEAWGVLLLVWVVANFIALQWEQGPVFLLAFPVSRACCAPCLQTFLPPAKLTVTVESLRAPLTFHGDPLCTSNLWGPLVHLWLSVVPLCTSDPPDEVWEGWATWVLQRRLPIEGEDLSHTCRAPSMKSQVIFGLGSVLTTPADPNCDFMKNKCIL